MSARPKSVGSIALWVRIILGLGAAGSGVIGYFAIMRPDTPEVGGVAFVALAGLFAVLAVIGRVPQKVNAGSMGVEFGDAEKVIQATEPLSPESRTEFAEALKAQPDLSPAYRLASDAILAGADWERAVLDALDAHGWVDYEFWAMMPHGTVFDTVIVIDNSRYGVQIKSAARSPVVGLFGEFEESLDVMNLQGAILITGQVKGPATDSVITYGRVFVIPASKLREIPRIVRRLFPPDRPSA